MKTTIKTRIGTIIVEPLRDDRVVRLVAQMEGQGIGLLLTPDQAGALIFGIEQALETNEAAAQRMAA